MKDLFVLCVLYTCILLAIRDCEQKNSHWDCVKVHNESWFCRDAR